MLDLILEYIANNPEQIAGLITITGGSVLASIITAITKTRSSLWYKAFEAVALNVFRAKDK
jgi:hypothetical protein